MNGSLLNWACTIHFTRTIDWSIVKLDLYHPSYHGNLLIIVKLDLYHPSYQDNWLIHCQIGLVPSILPGKLSGPLSNWNCTIHLPWQLTAPLSNWTCTIHLIRTIDWSIVKLDLCHPSYQDNWLLHCQIGLAPSILPGQLTDPLSNWTCTIHLIRTIDCSIVKLDLHHPSYQGNWLIHCQIGLVPSILPGQLTDPLSNWTCTIHLIRTIDWSIVKLDLYHPSYQDNWLLHCQIGLAPSIWAIGWSIVKLDLYHPSYQDNWLIHCQIGLVPSILPRQLTDPLSNWTCTIYLTRKIVWSIVKLELYHPSYQDNWLLHCQIGLVPSILLGKLTDPLSNWYCTVYLPRTIDWSIVKLTCTIHFTIEWIIVKLGLHHPFYQDNWLIHCQIGLVPSILPRQLTDPLSNWTCTIHLIRTIDWSIVKLDLYHLSYQENWIHCQIGIVPSILPGQLTAPLSNWNCTIHLIRTIDWSIVKLDLYHPSYQDNWLLHCQIGLAPSILPGQLTDPLSNWTCTIHLIRTIDCSIVKLDLHHPSYQGNWLIHCQIGLVPSILPGQLTDPLSNWACWACTIHLIRTIDWSIVKLDLHHPSYQDNWLIHCQIGLAPSILPGQLTDPLSNWTCTIHLIRTIDWSIVKLDLYHPSYHGQLTDPLSNWTCTIHLTRKIVWSIVKLELYHPPSMTIDWSIVKLDLYHPSYQDNWLIHYQIGLVPSILSGQLTDPLSNWTCTIHLTTAIDWSIVKLDLYHLSYQENCLVHCQIGIVPSTFHDNWLLHCQIGIVPSILSGQLTDPLSNWTCAIHLIRTIDCSIVKLELYHPSYQDNWLIHCQIGIVPTIFPGQLTDPLVNWACTIHLTRTIEWSIVKLDLYHPSYQDNWLIHCQIGIVPSILSGQLTAPLSNWTCTIHLTRTIDWSIIKLELHHPSYQDNWLIHYQIGIAPSILPGQLTAPLSNWACTIHLTRTIDCPIVKLGLYHSSYQENWLIHCQIGIVQSILPGQLTDPLSNWNCTIHLIRRIEFSIVKLDLHHPSYHGNWLLHCQIGHCWPSILSGQLDHCQIGLVPSILQDNWDCSIVKLDLYHPSYQDNWLLHCQIGLAPSILPRQLTDQLSNWACTIHLTKAIDCSIVKLDLHHPSYQDNWLIHCQIGIVPSILTGNWLVHCHIGIVPSILPVQLTGPLSHWNCTIYLTSTIDWSIVKLELYHISYQDNWLIHCQIGLAPSILPGQRTDPLSNWACTIHLTRTIDWSIVKLELYHPSYQDNRLIHCQIGLAPSILPGQLTASLSNWTCTIHLTKRINWSICVRWWREGGEGGGGGWGRACVPLCAGCEHVKYKNEKNRSKHKPEYKTGQIVLVFAYFLLSESRWKIYTLLYVNPHRSRGRPEGSLFVR